MRVCVCVRACVRVCDTYAGCHWSCAQLDDDIVFVRDGSLEHLVYQTLTNDDYTLYSGAVVNNPHGFALHAFVGAYPQTTYHWRDVLGGDYRSLPPQRVVSLYYGNNLYDDVGSYSHEAFIHNAALGQLHVYSFDVWNMNQCQCVVPQPGLDKCTAGYYRYAVVEPIGLESNKQGV